MSFDQNKQHLQKVYLNSDVYTVCLQHALSTEKDEIMGLLIGETDELNGISNISAVLILRRSDKQPDRVEISTEQLMAATTYAEELAQKLQRQMRVVGWYHSHPHITVWPSSVDVHTQAAYQNMDKYFVGLIFSVFPNKTRTNGYLSTTNEMKLTCFQSSDSERRNVPIIIKQNGFSEWNIKMMTSLPTILRDEEEEIAARFGGGDKNGDPLIGFYNSTHKYSGLINIVQKTAMPTYEALKNRKRVDQQRLRSLEIEEQLLIEELKKLEQM